MKFLASSVRETLGESRNSERGSRDPYMTSFDLMLHFCLPSSFLASTFRQILGGYRNSKCGSRDPYITPFDLVLHISLSLTAVRLRAKFEVSNFNRSRAFRGSLNSNSRSRDPT